ncbi:MAG TPA: hypothetical protein VKY74_12130 [Chloroflexia bacterium]|nr:hypothetical protein [Chloroflexia bacterium]
MPPDDRDTTARNAEALAAVLATEQARARTAATLGRPGADARPAAETLPAAERPASEPPNLPLRPGWHRPRPARLPPPSYWPTVLALGVMFLFWGLVSSLIVSGVGLVLLGIGLAGWVGELRRAE